MYTVAICTTSMRACIKKGRTDSSIRSDIVDAYYMAAIAAWPKLNTVHYSVADIHKVFDDILNDIDNRIVGLYGRPTDCENTDIPTQIRLWLSEDFSPFHIRYEF